MPGLSILDLPMPPDQYRVDLLPRTEGAAWQFETEEQSRDEDVLRAKLAIKHANMAACPENATAAMCLDAALRYGEHRGPCPPSMASSMYMREQRIKVIGGLCQRLTEDGLPASTVTLSLPGCDIPEPKLDDLNPEPINERLRGAINRNGGIDARGWAAFFMHGEREPTSKMFRIHYHGVVTGDMIAVIDKLRKDLAFKPLERQVGTLTKRYMPIRMSRAPIDDPFRAISYLLKPYWPESWEGEIDGEAKRRDRHTRIQGPAHTRALLWLDRYRLDQISLLMGLRVGRAGLIPTKL